MASRRRGKRTPAISQRLPRRPGSWRALRALSTTHTADPPDDRRQSIGSVVTQEWYAVKSSYDFGFGHS